MKYSITDLSSLCCPENVDLGENDKASADRIKSMVMSELNVSERKPKLIRMRTVIIAAVIAALLSTAVFAVCSYVMNRQEAEGTVTGHWIEKDENGNIISYQEFIYPDAGLVLSFDGPSENMYRPQFRAFWLPETSRIIGQTDEEGWTDYLLGKTEDGELAFLITCENVNTGNSKMVLNGKTELISEDSIDGWEILKVSSDYTGTGFERAYKYAKYIFMFNEKYGYFLYVGGEADLDTLEKIAEGLEVRVSDEKCSENPYSESVGILDIGEG